MTPFRHRTWVSRPRERPATKRPRRGAMARFAAGPCLAKGAPHALSSLLRRPARGARPARGLRAHHGISPHGLRARRPPHPVRRAHRRDGHGTHRGERDRLLGLDESVPAGRRHGGPRPAVHDRGQRDGGGVLQRGARGARRVCELQLVAAERDRDDAAAERPVELGRGARDAPRVPGHEGQALRNRHRRKPHVLHGAVRGVAARWRARAVRQHRELRLLARQQRERGALRVLARRLPVVRVRPPWRVRARLRPAGGDQRLLERRLHQHRGERQHRQRGRADRDGRWRLRHLVRVAARVRHDVPSPDDLVVPGGLRPRAHADRGREPGSSAGDAATRPRLRPFPSEVRRA